MEVISHFDLATETRELSPSSCNQMVTSILRECHRSPPGGPTGGGRSSVCCAPHRVAHHADAFQTTQPTTRQRLPIIDESSIGSHDRRRVVDLVVTRNWSNGTGWNNPQRGAHPLAVGCLPWIPVDFGGETVVFFIISEQWFAEPVSREGGGVQSTTLPPHRTAPSGPPPGPGPLDDLRLLLLQSKTRAVRLVSRGTPRKANKRKVRNTPPALF